MAMESRCARTLPQANWRPPPAPLAAPPPPSAPAVYSGIAVPALPSKNLQSSLMDRITDGSNQADADLRPHREPLPPHEPAANGAANACTGQWPRTQPPAY